MRTNRWQYSIRCMFLVTTLTAVILVIGLELPHFVAMALIVGFTVLLVIGLIRPAEISKSDHAPRHSTLSWLLSGILVCAYAAIMFRRNFDAVGQGSPEEQGVFIIMVAGGIVCFWRAIQSFARAYRCRTPDDCASSEGPM